MKYFIDFEATQFSNEIISIGCVNEKNQTFYSLVQSKKKITPFITSLTGLTKEQIEEAPNTDKVFSDFFDWLDHSEPAEFYCYGDCDIEYVNKNLNLHAHCFKSQCALSLISTNLIDYSNIVRKHFGLRDCIGLVKVVTYYRKLMNPFKQRHNALEDALFLKEVYDGINAEQTVIGDPFPEYTKRSDMVTKIDEINENSTINLDCIVHRKKKGEILTTYNSMAEAVEAALLLIPVGDRELAAKNKNRIACKINRASQRKEKYSGFRWEVIKNEKKEK